LASPLGFSLIAPGLDPLRRDAAIVLNVTAGCDPATRPLPGVRGGLRSRRGCSSAGSASAFRRISSSAWIRTSNPPRGAIARAESLGARIMPVRLPDVAALNAVARVIPFAEASAVAEPYFGERLFGPDVLALLTRAVSCPPPTMSTRSGFAAKQSRPALKQVDCLLAPTTPSAAAHRRHHTAAADA
jgi:hypothetical protein